jgi:4-amino-4-deoxy-L-arabinose transferase-like glycosyltransferase
MHRLFGSRLGHHALLAALTAALTLPNLGASSLWDMDEALNAEAAREMLEAGNWVVPTFNFQLRTAKPALLYWLQMLAYQAFGVSEFSARLPSALAGAVAVLCTYEIGRKLFDARTGLLGGVILASVVQFGLLAHASTPDALLLASVVFTFMAFALSDGCRSGWAWLGVGAGTGLAIMAKGPAGLVLPTAVVWATLIWDGNWRRLLSRGVLGGVVVFALVGLPWYVLIGLETHGEFIRAFLGHDNVNRFRSALEGHSGPPYYYPAVLLVGFAPWSVFLGPTVWYAGRELWRDLTPRPPSLRGKGEQKGRSAGDLAEAPGAGSRVPPFPPREGGRGVRCHNPLSPYRFLTCWVLAYLVCFSLAATKLPNYVMPLYPALALLTARYLERWRTGLLRPPGWLIGASVAGLLLVGVGVGVGLAVAGGAVEVPALRGRTLAGLGRWAALGAVPVVAAAVAFGCLARGRRTGVVLGVTAGSVGFLALLGAFGPTAVEPFKGPRALVEQSGACDLDREVRVATFDYNQPSLVFYCRREVQGLDDPAKAVDFLASPLPVYLFVPAKTFDALRPAVATPHRLIGRQWDLYRNCEIVVVTNR